jgi:fatty acid amide hydrolase 2
VIKAYIQRCEEVNPLINAIVENRFEDALEEAKQVDADIANQLRTIEQMEKDLPLLGLPITVKESIGVTGMSHQGGRVYLKKKIAREDSDIVRMARKHGGIVLLVR